MKELILILTAFLKNNSLFICFLPEIFCILGIVANVSFIPFVIKNFKFKKISNITTGIVFCINSFILAMFLLFNNTTLSAGDLIIFSKEALSLKLFINIFAIFFIAVTYKYTAKAQHRLPVINSIFLLIIMLCGVLLTSDNFAFIYVLIEGIIILIYKYASNMRLSKKGIFSSVYIAVSFCATCLFVIFYFMDYVVDDVMQKSIMQSCMVVALLLKIGLFPVFNYSIDKKCRSNISYCILLFCMLPFVAAFMFNKIISQCMFNEICQIITVIFLLCCAFCASVVLFKAKKLIIFLINSAQVYFCFYILNLLFMKDLNLEFMFIVTAVFFILYSMLRIYKNTKINKVIFSAILILMAFIIPLFAHDILYNIYTFDKYGFYVLNTIIFCNFLIIIKTLNIVESLYKIKD